MVSSGMVRSWLCGSNGSVQNGKINNADAFPDAPFEREGGRELIRISSFPTPKHY